MSFSCFIERVVPGRFSGCIHPAAIASLRDLRLRGHRRSTGECAGDLTPPPMMSTPSSATSAAIWSLARSTSTLAAFRSP